LKRWEPAEGVQGCIVLIGSVSSEGNKGQISYATAKAGLEGAQATLAAEAIFFGVRCAIIQQFIREHIIPQTQLRRLIQPEEIAHAICFMIRNAAVSGTLWVDAGWHPTV
jgi:NAD(P)-dependent dehydrogenase (short-subunit alcohol dehydrogenase family)